MNIKLLLSSVLLSLFLLPVKAQNIVPVAVSGIGSTKNEAPRDSTTIQLISDDRVTILRSDVPGKQVVLSNPVARRKKYFGCPEVPNSLCAPVKDAPSIAPEVPPRLDVKPEIKPVKGKPFFLPDPVFFRINKSIIDAAEWAKIELAVDYLNKYPDATVVVTGYADKKTGNVKINLKLSEQRSNAVAKAMETKYGIKRNRISINWKGDGLQPFELENDKNRAVLFLINP